MTENNGERHLLRFLGPVVYLGVRLQPKNGTTLTKFEEFSCMQSEIVSLTKWRCKDCEIELRIVIKTTTAKTNNLFLNYGQMQLNYQILLRS